MKNKDYANMNEYDLLDEVNRLLVIAKQERKAGKWDTQTDKDIDRIIQIQKCRGNPIDFYNNRAILLRDTRRPSKETLQYVFELQTWQMKRLDSINIGTHRTLNRLDNMNSTLNKMIIPNLILGIILLLLVFLT